LTSFFFKKKSANCFVRQRYKSEFQEISSLGKGGFGKVIKCQHKLDGSLYAVKKIPFQLKEKSSVDLVLREVNSLAKLDHINICRYYNAWIESFVGENEKKNESKGNRKKKLNSERSLTNISQGLHINSEKQNYHLSENSESESSSLFSNENNSFNHHLLQKRDHFGLNLSQTLDERALFFNVENRKKFVGEEWNKKKEIFSETETDEKPTSQNKSQKTEIFSFDMDEKKNDDINLFEMSRITSTDSIVFEEDMSLSLSKENKNKILVVSNDDMIKKKNKNFYDLINENLNQKFALIEYNKTEKIEKTDKIERKKNRDKIDSESERKEIEKNAKKMQKISFILYIQMHLYEKKTLFDHFCDPKREIKKKEIFFIFKQILEGVKEIHNKGIIHRDLKPQVEALIIVFLKSKYLLFYF
jgi:hypothetical protein